MSTQPPRPTDPCLPDPCGRYAQCRNVGGVAACSCLPGYVGVPPNCRPECLIHSECPSNRACIDEKCRDPCPGACAAGAECTVIMHNAVCRCQQGYEGDPFTGCRRVTTSEYCMFLFFICLSYHCPSKVGSVDKIVLGTRYRVPMSNIKVH